MPPEECALNLQQFEHIAPENVIEHAVGLMTKDTLCVKVQVFLQSDGLTGTYIQRRRKGNDFAGASSSGFLTETDDIVHGTCQILIFMIEQSKVPG